MSGGLARSAQQPYRYLERVELVRVLPGAVLLLVPAACGAAPVRKGACCDSWDAAGPGCLLGGPCLRRGCLIMEREESFGDTRAELPVTPVGLEVILKVHLGGLAENLNADLDDRARSGLVAGLAGKMEPAAAAALAARLTGASRPPWVVSRACAQFRAAPY